MAAVAGAAALAAAAAVCLWTAWPHRFAAPASVQGGAAPRDVVALAAEPKHGGNYMHPVQDGQFSAFIPMPGPQPEDFEKSPQKPASEEHAESAHEKAHPAPAAARTSHDRYAPDVPPGTPIDFQVIFDGMVHIRAAPDTASNVIGDLFKCGIFKALPQGDWVQLVAQPGYVVRSMPGSELIRPIPVYYQFKSGTCENQGFRAYPIRDAMTCELAAAAMQLPDRTADEEDGQPSPQGCYMRGGSLHFAKKSDMTTEAVTSGTELICSSYSETPDMCLPTTTTSTTTDASERAAARHFPSLFCYCVVRSQGYEAPLVRKQIAAKAGIFSCDDHLVLSNGGKVWLKDDWFAKEINLAQVGMGDLNQAGVTTNSWLNTEIFMYAWDMIREDGRFENHDWTMKADPDAVIFAWRIRDLVRPHTPVEPSRTPKTPPFSDLLYFLNCNRVPPTAPGKPALFGAVELFSKRALLTYYYSSFKSGIHCKKELPWHGWGEDLYMQKCMDLIGAKAVHEFGWVADKRCIPGTCSEPNHAAFHDFKDEGSWFQCWNQGLQVTPRP